MPPVPEPKAVAVEPTSAAENLIRCDSQKRAWPTVALPLDPPPFWTSAQYQPTHWPDLAISAPEFQSTSERLGLLPPLPGVGQSSARAGCARSPARAALRKDWWSQLRRQM